MEGWHCHKICKCISNIIPTFTKYNHGKIKSWSSSFSLFSDILPSLFPPYYCNPTSLEERSNSTIPYSVSVSIPPSLSHTHTQLHPHLPLFNIYTGLKYILYFCTHYHPSGLHGPNLF